MADIPVVKVPLGFPGFSNGPIKTIKNGFKSVLPDPEPPSPPIILMNPNQSYPGEPMTPPRVVLNVPNTTEINPDTGKAYTSQDIVDLQEEYDAQAKAREERDHTTPAGETEEDVPSGDFSPDGTGADDGAGTNKDVRVGQFETKDEIRKNMG